MGSLPEGMKWPSSPLHTERNTSKAMQRMAAWPETFILSKSLAVFPLQAPTPPTPHMSKSPYNQTVPAAYVLLPLLNPLLVPAPGPVDLLKSCPAAGKFSLSATPPPSPATVILAAFLSGSRLSSAALA